MRHWGALALACMAVAGCGGEPERGGKDGARGSGELTVTLPPTLPTERAVQDPAPEAGFETIAPAEPVETPPKLAKAPPRPKNPEPKEAPAEVEVALAPTPDAAAPAEGAAGAEPGAADVNAAAAATRPAGAGAWAGYLRRAGFPCQRIASANRIERGAGPGFQYYKVDCEGGGSYQATNKRGHLYFRRWRG